MIKDIDQRARMDDWIFKKLISNFCIWKIKVLLTHPPIILACGEIFKAIAKAV